MYADVGANVDLLECQSDLDQAINPTLAGLQLDNLVYSPLCQISCITSTTTTTTLSCLLTLEHLDPDMLKTAGTVLTGAFMMAMIVKRAKSSLQSNGLVEGKESEVTPEIWGF